MRFKSHVQVFDQKIQAKYECGCDPLNFDKVVPLLNLKKYHKFLVSALSREVCIRFELHVQICLRNTQVKFEFGPSQMIFDRIIQLEFRKK
jgi:hypothetical protein